jgi:hypothetical protein
MAVRMNVKGVEMVAETADDVRTILAALGALENGAASHGEERASEPQRNSVRIRKLDQSASQLNALVDRLGSDAQRAVLESLGKAPKGLRDHELRANLGLKTNVQLAGVLCGISRHAGALGIKTDQVMRKKRVRTPDGERGYYYELTRQMRDVLGHRA